MSGGNSSRRRAPVIAFKSARAGDALNRYLSGRAAGGGNKRPIY